MQWTTSLERLTGLWASRVTRGETQRRNNSDRNVGCRGMRLTYGTLVTVVKFCLWPCFACRRENSSLTVSRRIDQISPLASFGPPSTSSTYYSKLFFFTSSSRSKRFINQTNMAAYTSPLNSLPTHGYHYHVCPDKATRLPSYLATSPEANPMHSTARYLATSFRQCASNQKHRHSAQV